MKLDFLQTPEETVRLKGIGVSAGIAIGPALVIDHNKVPVPTYTLEPEEITDELARFSHAVEKTKKHLAMLQTKAKALPSGAAEEVALLFEAYGGMLNGSRLLRGVEAQIKQERLNAEAAIQKQIEALASSFAKMGDSYLSSRVADIREIGARLIRNLLHQNYNPFADAPFGSIPIAEEITPADAALLDPKRVAGFAAVLGGPEGHAAIMARAMGPPAVLGVGGLIAGVETGDLAILDGEAGEIILRPDPETLESYRAKALASAEDKARLERMASLPPVTKDGAKVALNGNLELPKEAETALAAGAEGIGLLRSEFLFMNRPDLPSEDEQFEILRNLVETLDGKELTVRTLDVGGEKLASALGDFGTTQNPALGLRAIRLGLSQPVLLETQLAAILRASAFGRIRILIPMVSSASQMLAVRTHLLRVEERLRDRGAALPTGLPPLGAMIEIPGAALSADALAKVCNFFSIGSNDLTQYTLAIDRGDDRVAPLYDPFHPGVLRLIQFTLSAAWRANIPVSLCGEMAGDPKATALLLGLGLRDFSMSPSRLARVKEQIRGLTIPEATAFAEKVLSENREENIRALLAEGVKRREQTEEPAQGC